MLFNSKNEVFVGKRIDTMVEAWQMPQGGIDEGESPEEALFREMLEEVGTSNAQIIYESKKWYYYDLPEHLIGKLWKGKYMGQKQKWFALRFLGNDEDINIKTGHPEFEKWKWADFTTVPDMIVPFKKDLYKDLVDDFLPIISESG
ncbi:RNA pyrophosphohydrolase [Rickettsiales bacterium]|nr:RNA pyrophosphohydrolase [Rickettsiales bacterium]